jgi:hypothetical protein
MYGTDKKVAEANHLFGLRGETSDPGVTSSRAANHVLALLYSQSIPPRSIFPFLKNCSCLLNCFISLQIIRSYISIRWILASAPESPEKRIYFENPSPMSRLAKLKATFSYSCPIRPNDLTFSSNYSRSKTKSNKLSLVTLD